MTDKTPGCNLCFWSSSRPRDATAARARSVDPTDRRSPLSRTTGTVVNTRGHRNDRPSTRGGGPFTTDAEPIGTESPANMLLSTPPRRGGGTIKGNPGGNLAYGASIMTRPGKLIPILGLVAVVFFVAVYRCAPDPSRKPRPDPDLSAPSIYQTRLFPRLSRSSRPSSTDDTYPTLSTPQGDRDARAAKHALGGHACRPR